MRYCVFLSMLVCLLGLVWAAQSPADDAPFSLAPRRGYLLLNNGHVLEGRVTQAGEYYYVALDHGEIRVRAEEVTGFCRDLDEGYRLRRAQIKGGNLHEHLDLADWCLQHKLYGNAARELVEAVKLDPKHPRVAFIERRLELARQPPPPIATSDKTNALREANQELDELVRRLPAGTVDAYVGTVQPMLVNYCSNAGCHGPASETRFSLLRLPIAKNMTRRLTQRNLAETLRWINLDEPTASPLLIKAIEPHGGASKPPLTQRELTQYQQLAAWVLQVANNDTGPKPTSLTPPAPNLLQAAPMAAPLAGKSDSEKSDVVQANFEEPVDNSSTSHPTTQEGPQHGAKLPGYVPVDPFDPEVFNRRFFPESAQPQ